MSIEFEKIHACGNDFLLVQDEVDSRTLEHMCDRNHGIGADGIMRFHKGSQPLKIDHFDADGSRSFCVNGLRSSLHCLRSKALVGACGQVVSEGIHVDYSIGTHVTLTLPWAAPTPLVWQGASRQVVGYSVQVGNPQFVTWQAVDESEMHRLAPLIRNDHRVFPQGTNVNFLTARENGYAIASFERGVEGFTKACGSGMLAAACVVLAQQEEGGTVFYPQGMDWVDITRNGSSLILSGPSHWVASGVWRCGCCSF